MVSWASDVQGGVRTADVVSNGATKRKSMVKHFSCSTANGRESKLSLTGPRRKGVLNAEHSSYDNVCDVCNV